MQDFVLQTKLHPPQLKGKISRRARLLNLLKENLDKKLILICADAGYGKTTLLAQFCEEVNKPFVFYDLDSSDNDIATFFNYLVAGIQRHCPDFGKRVRSVLPQTRNIEIIVGTFINEFLEHFAKNEQTNACPHFYIILDDYHHLQQNREIGNAIDYLLRHIPPNLHLIISSRSTPPLNLAYYLAKQELFRIEKDHLQFNIKEIQELLKEQYGLKVPDSEIERIEKHSEGWITAIQLILQKIQAAGENKTKETLNGYIASGEEIFDYFAREVFESQPKEIQEFLMKTSIFEEITPEICRDVLKIENAANIFTYLLEKHLFVSNVGANVYKIHHLFRIFLVEKLQTIFSVQLYKDLSNRAGKYFAKNNLPALSIQSYMNAGNLDMVIRVLIKNVVKFIETGKIDSIEHWLDLIPEVFYQRYPLLALYKGYILRVKGKFHEAWIILTKAKSICTNLNRWRNYLASIYLELCSIAFSCGDCKRAEKYIEKALKCTCNYDSKTKMGILCYLGCLMEKKGDWRKAERFFLDGLNLCERLGKLGGAGVFINNLGALYGGRGFFERAEEFFRKGITLIEDGNFWPNMALVYENLAGIKINQREYKDAEDLLKKGLSISERYSDRFSQSYIYSRIGELLAKLGHLTEAMNYQSKALNLAVDIGSQEAQVEILCKKGEIFLMYGKPLEAKECLISAAKIAGTKKRIDIGFLDAKLNLAEKDYNSAMKSASWLVNYTRKYGLNYYQCQAHLLLAKVYSLIGERKKAVARLKESLRISKLYGYRKLLHEEMDETVKKIMGVEAKQDIPYSDSKKMPVIEKRGVALFVKFFGVPEISIDGRLVSGKLFTKKTKKLLLYFVCNRSRPIGKDRIIEELWPECEPTKGINNFYVHLNYLRSSILLGERKRYSRAIILSCDNSYYLDPDIIVKSDTEEFEMSITHAKVAYQNREYKKAISILEKAIGTYHPFCENWYDEWVIEKREYYENLYLDAVSLLIKILFEQDQFNRCIKYCKKYLLTDKYNEEITQKLISCLLKLKKYKEAKIYYDNFCAVFKKLGMQPNIKLTTGIN